MRQYCGFIEVWKGKNFNHIFIHDTPVSIAIFDFALLNTKKYGMTTIAIFKIKLDGGFNKHKQHENIH